jgi:glycosyltransferase involved in cell wall biosynthesis
MNESRRIRVAMVTNIPAPYRLPIYERVVKHQDIDFCVFFCSGREPDREWDLQEAAFKQVYFKEKFITYRNRYIHCNPDAWSALKAFRPDVIVTTGFNPTFLVAYLYARLHGARHVAMTDGTAFTESGLSFVHRLVRRVVYGGSRAFIGASEGSFKLYRCYGVSDASMFQSHLCADNDAYRPVPPGVKRHDFVFSARFIEAKNPLFAMDVAAGTARRLKRRLSLLLLGSGEMEGPMREKAEAIREHVDVTFAGFVKQADLPAHYASARILLFPTAIDTWGVVANEACAAGLPVLVTPMAGVADDLVVDGDNGFVLPLDEARWTDACTRLLSDARMYERFARASVDRVARFSYDHAAQGICDAVRHVVSRA